MAARRSSTAGRQLCNTCGMQSMRWHCLRSPPGTSLSKHTSISFYFTLLKCDAAVHASPSLPLEPNSSSRYYFPTYENDGLLCALSDSDGESDPAGWGADIPVISEDVSTLEALRQNSVLSHLLEDSPPMGAGAM